jgi:hypothetical protein
MPPARDRAPAREPRRSAATAKAANAAGVQPPRTARAGSVVGRTVATVMRTPVEALVALSGLDTATRALERFSASASRAAALLDTIDEQLGVDRVVDMVARLDRLGYSAERAAAFFDRFDAEFGIDRTLELLRRGETLVATGERAGAFFEQIDTEVGAARLVELIDRLDTLTAVLRELGTAVARHAGADTDAVVAGSVDRLQHLVDLVEEMNRNLAGIEALVVDLRGVASQSIDTIPLARTLIRRRADRRAREQPTT